MRELKEGSPAVDAFCACFPAGTLSGAPKIRAMEIIEELEPTRRGIYGGSVFYADFSGNFDSCIAIRSMLLKGEQGYIQAGGGIVADSVPEEEYEESVNKARRWCGRSNGRELTGNRSREQMSVIRFQRRFWLPGKPGLQPHVGLDLRGTHRSGEERWYLCW